MSGTTALYGGTFDPPHTGHRAVLETVSAAYDSVVVMPAARPPHKELSSLTPCAGHRMEMVRLLAEGLHNVTVSDYELAQNRVCYTVETLEWIERARPNERLALVVGTDMFLSLPSWYAFERLIGMAEIAVLSRKDGTLDRRQTMEYSGKWGARVRFLEHTPVEISSTRLRELLSEPATRNGAEGLAERVREYIMEHGLYTREGA